MKWKIDNLNDLEKVVQEVLKKAEKIIQKNNGAVILALFGDLGSGKTTFTKHLAKSLGVVDRITSPTFVIQKTFDIPESPEDLKTKNLPFKKLIHIDTYRIDLQDELVRLNWPENISQSKNLVVIEWPENILDILPNKNTISLYFKFIDETTREIEMEEIKI